MQTSMEGATRQVLAMSDPPSTKRLRRKHTKRHVEECEVAQKESPSNFFYRMEGVYVRSNKFFPRKLNFGTILTPKNCCYLFVEISARIKRRENSSPRTMAWTFSAWDSRSYPLSIENIGPWLFRVYRGFYCPVIWGI